MKSGTWVRLAPLLAALCACWSVSALAAPAQFKITREPTVSSPQNHVRVVVTATDQDGHAIKDLSSAQFGLSVDGVAANISTVERTTSNDQPLAVVLAMDVSGSMAKNEAFAGAREAAIAFVNRLAPGDQVSLITFGDSAKRLTGFASDKTQVWPIFSALKPADQQTVLYEGVFKAAEQATQATTGKVVVIILTDGKDEGSSITLEDAAGKAQANAVAVYTLGFGPHADQKTLRRISELTGGEYRYAPTAAELPGLYQAIWERLKDAYAVEGDTQVLHPGSHKISVTLNYRDQQLVDTTNLVVPRPPLPRWVLVTAGVVVFFALLLACVGWAVTRQTRSKKVVEVTPVQSPIWIDVVEGAQRSRRIRMLSKSLRIGRATDCDLRSDDPSMGAHHAEIVLEGSAASLRDGGSEFPTLLNGNRLRPNQSVRLRNGDRITTGTTVFIFCDQRQQSLQPAQDPAALAMKR